jgi:hypothetical protein
MQAAAVVLLGCALAWFLLIRDDDSGSAPAAGEGPRLASAGDLEALADEVGHPVFWAGPRDGEEVEVTRTGEDQIYVRYLTSGAEPGDPRPEFLTVGTYPASDATATPAELAQAEGALTTRTPDGELAVTNENNPFSVYLSGRGSDLQIEVYDPNPGRAFKLARRGEIAPVG